MPGLGKTNILISPWFHHWKQRTLAAQCKIATQYEIFLTSCTRVKQENRFPNDCQLEKSRGKLGRFSIFMIVLHAKNADTCMRVLYSWSDRLSPWAFQFQCFWIHTNDELPQNLWEQQQVHGIFKQAYMQMTNYWGTVCERNDQQTLYIQENTSEEWKLRPWLLKIKTFYTYTCLLSVAWGTPEKWQTPDWTSTQRTCFFSKEFVACIMMATRPANPTDAALYCSADARLPSEQRNEPVPARVACEFSARTFAASTHQDICIKFCVKLGA